MPYNALSVLYVNNLMPEEANEHIDRVVAILEAELPGFAFLVSDRFEGEITGENVKSAIICNALTMEKEVDLGGFAWGGVRRKGRVK